MPFVSLWLSRGAGPATPACTGSDCLTAGQAAPAARRQGRCRRRQSACGRPGSGLRSACWMAARGSGPLPGWSRTRPQQCRTPAQPGQRSAAAQQGAQTLGCSTSLHGCMHVRLAGRQPGLTWISRATAGALTPQNRGPCMRTWAEARALAFCRAASSRARPASSVSCSACRCGLPEAPNLACSNLPTGCRSGSPRCTQAMGQASQQRLPSRPHWRHSRLVLC